MKFRVSLTGIAAIAFWTLSSAAPESTPIIFPADAVVQIYVPPDQIGEEYALPFWAGTLISPDGLVLTCASRAKPGNNMSVTLHNGQRYQAKLVGSDMRTNFALLKIAAETKNFAQIDGYSPVYGEKVLAIGPASSSTPDISEGITDPLNKGMDSSRAIISSAQINKGMACGPLVLASSQKVIAINTHELVPKNGARLAVSDSISAFLKISDQLTKFGRVRRGQIGVTLADLSSEDAELLGVPKGYTALIKAPLPNSAAEAAGFLPGDVILRINGAEVPTASTAASILSNSLPQSQLVVEFIRRAKKMQITVTTTEQK
jgi:serine protease Do